MFWDNNNFYMSVCPYATNRTVTTHYLLGNLQCSEQY